jgi:hypothetical protein
MSEAAWTDPGRQIDTADVARRTVTSAANVATFGERGFRTVINGRVLDRLFLDAGLDRGAALVAARKAIEEVGGLVVGSRSDADAPTRRPISEVWMIPETAVLPAVAPPPAERRPRAA